MTMKYKFSTTLKILIFIMLTIGIDCQKRSLMDTTKDETDTSKKDKLDNRIDEYLKTQAAKSCKDDFTNCRKDITSATTSWIAFDKAKTKGDTSEMTRLGVKAGAESVRAFVAGMKLCSFGVPMISEMSKLVEGIVEIFLPKKVEDKNAYFDKKFKELRDHQVEMRDALIDFLLENEQLEKEAFMRTARTTIEIIFEDIPTKEEKVNLVRFKTFWAEMINARNGVLTQLVGIEKNLDKKFIAIEGPIKLPINCIKGAESEMKSCYQWKYKTIHLAPYFAQWQSKVMKSWSSQLSPGSALIQCEKWCTEEENGDCKICWDDGCKVRALRETKMVFFKINKNLKDMDKPVSDMCYQLGKEARSKDPNLHYFSAKKELMDDTEFYHQLQLRYNKSPWILYKVQGKWIGWKKIRKYKKEKPVPVPASEVHKYFWFVEDITKDFEWFGWENEHPKTGWYVTDQDSWNYASQKIKRSINRPDCRQNSGMTLEMLETADKIVQDIEHVCFPPKIEIQKNYLTMTEDSDDNGAQITARWRNLVTILPMLTTLFQESCYAAQMWKQENDNWSFLEMFSKRGDRSFFAGILDSLSKIENKIKEKEKDADCLKPWDNIVKNNNKLPYKDVKHFYPDNNQKGCFKDMIKELKNSVVACKQMVDLANKQIEWGTDQGFREVVQENFRENREIRLKRKTIMDKDNRGIKRTEGGTIKHGDIVHVCEVVGSMVKLNGRESGWFDLEFESRFHGRTELVMTNKKCEIDPKIMFAGRELVAQMEFKTPDGHKVKQGEFLTVKQSESIKVKEGESQTIWVGTENVPTWGVDENRFYYFQGFDDKRKWLTKLLEYTIDSKVISTGCFVSMMIFMKMNGPFDVLPFVGPFQFVLVSVVLMCILKVARILLC